MWVYIAHPAFTDEQREFKRRLITGLKEHLGKLKHARTISLIDPFDHAPDIEGSTEGKAALSKEVKETCLDFLDRCKLLIAVVDHDDTGTAFEAGYAYRMQIPIILISEGNCDSANAMLLGSAHARFDNVLDDLQLSLLAGLIEWHYLCLLGPRLVPRDD